ncbi:hypothetical protein MAPG_02125 [Magnaporthiopsis poae ATCC 64411]|uniref:Uncharacterized protein n=1 Tax=Magnaporthiopsis poae (strain ATCC 64411 / 73-15) TaxID=644358 RepID=A0A0C4DQI2_MAGP6|nr:hypothetical protein MAPG_02125 [Magnaporthiopsis poae ATCC 64411]
MQMGVLQRHRDPADDSRRSRLGLWTGVKKSGELSGPEGRQAKRPDCGSGRREAPKNFPSGRDAANGATRVTCVRWGGEYDINSGRTSDERTSNAKH